MKTDIHRIVRTLRKETRRWTTPAVTEVAKSREPFNVLISTLLSLRTKDAVTYPASERLLSAAPTPERMLELPARRIERLIYPVCFYRVKARTIRTVCRQLLEEHGGKVPDSLERLLELHGVGRKTANLVRTLGFGKPGICVDTHVHRISNRLGYVRTKTPEETEMALRRKLPPPYWIEFNDLLVAYGQNLCVPVSPWCSRCRIAGDCARVGVGRSR